MGPIINFKTQKPCVLNHFLHPQINLYSYYLLRILNFGVSKICKYITNVPWHFKKKYNFIGIVVETSQWGRGFGLLIC